MRTGWRQSIHCHTVVLDGLPNGTRGRQMVIKADWKLLHLQTSKMRVTIDLILEVG
jgi:hypothetical protein